jgi:hypothetical protein
MKGLIVSLMLVIALGTLPATARQRTEERGRVQIHKEKRFAKSRLNGRFVELVEDSRCPTDTNCVWAGNARIKVRVTKNGESEEITLDTNGPKQYATTADGHSIKLVGLTPVPRSNIRINRNGYVAMFEIVKLTR